jgi:hypothetical protein
MRVLGGFSLCPTRGDVAPIEEDWDAIRRTIRDAIGIEQRLVAAVTVVSFHEFFDYAIAAPQQKLMYDLYRVVDSMGEVIRTFRNPLHNSTLNLVLFNPQKMGLSTYDF